MTGFSAYVKNPIKHSWLTAPCSKLIFRVGIQICIFIVLDRWIRAVGSLPEDSYFSPFLAGELLKNLFSTPLYAILSGIVISIFIGRLQFLWISWPKMKSEISARPFIVLLATLLCWWYVTYDYNLYFNQAHYLDRLLLIVLVFCIAWRPIFVLPFLLLVTALISQFLHPDPVSYSWAQPSMPLRLLTLFVTLHIFYAYHRERKKQKSSDWLLLSLCIIAAHYWGPAVGKMQLIWISYGHVHNIFQAAYANGWLVFLDTSQLSFLIRVLAEFDWFVRIATLTIQLAAVFLLWRRSFLIGLMTFWSLFHLGIFFVSGILFWQWIAIEIFAVWLLQTIWKDGASILFNRSHFVLSIFLIGTSMFWVRPVILAWYDTPISYTFRFEAIGKSGQRYTLPPRFFAPYDYPFTLGNFAYLLKSARLDVAWGGSQNREVADMLLQARTKEQIFEIEKQLNNNKFDQRKTENLEKFIRQFVINGNERGSKSTFFRPVQAPRQLWTFSRGSTYTFQEAIFKVNVYQATSWFDGNKYNEIDVKAVREISIYEY